MMNKGYNSYVKKMGRKSLEPPFNSRRNWLTNKRSKQIDIIQEFIAHGNDDIYQVLLSWCYYDKLPCCTVKKWMSKALITILLRS